MKKIKEILKSKSFLNWLIIIVIISLIGLPFLRFHITSDGYSHLMVNFTQGQNVLLSNTGRPLSDFVISYFNILGINIIEYQALFNLFAIILTIISMYLFYKEVNKVTNNKINSKLLLLFSIMFIYFNAFSFELYLFSVMFSITIQYLLITISLKFITENISFKNIVYSIILNGLGACFYQGASVLYLPLAFLLVGYINKNKSIKTYIIENIKVVIIFAFSLLSNFAYLKLLPFQNRYDNPIELKDRILNILNAQGMLWKETYNIFMKYSFFFIIVLLLIISLFVILKSKNENKEKLNDFLTLCLIFFGTIGASFAAVFVSGIIVAPRAILFISSLPGLLLLFILMFGKENKKSIFNLTLNLIALVFSLFLVEASSSMIGELVYTNNKDKSEIIQISDIIKDNDIHYVSFAPDMYISYTHSLRYDTLESHIKAFSTLWSRTNSMNYYLNKNFEEVEAPEEIKKYCSSKNWTKFDKEQIIIKNNTIYICIY